MPLLTNQHIANIFKMYLGQPVLIRQDSQHNGLASKIQHRPYVLAAVGTETCLPSFGNSLETFYPMPICPVDQFTLELLPFSELSNTEALVIAQLLFPENNQFEIERTLLHILFDISSFTAHSRNDIRLKINLAAGNSDTIPLWFESNYDFAGKLPLVYQYLISIGYDVPHFIEPGHAYNGKTAVQLGLARYKPRP